MKVLAITFGTEGDVRPLAALCRALIDAGHEARLLAPGDALDSATALCVPSVGLPGAVRDTLQAAGTTRNANGAAALARVANANALPWLQLALEHGRRCDVVIAGGLAAFVGFSAAEKLVALAVGAGMFPLTPTADFASPLIPPGATPAWANRLTASALNGLIWQGMAKAVNAARGKVGLPLRRRLWTDLPMLYGFSRHLIPRPADWPAKVVLCGAWSPPAPEWSPPEDLAAFLADGEPPIHVGFGSMTVSRPDPPLAALVAGIAGRRALFQPGWSGVSQPDLPANFRVIGPTPHDWLFPRVAMAIHHGGSGTSHAAARAGVPSIVAPFAGDQPFWADRLRRAGVATSLDVRRASAEAIAAAVAFADRNDVRDRAADLGRAMRAETGLATAVAHLEAWTSQVARSA